MSTLIVAGKRLDATLRQGRFGIVHIAWHGRFDDAVKSLILTSTGKLTLTQAEPFSLLNNGL